MTHNRACRFSCRAYCLLSTSL